MSIAYNPERLHRYVTAAFDASPGQPILLDRFLEDAFEIDVDALADGHDCIIAGIMQHIEEAGVHSGDSSSVMPTWLISEEHLKEIRQTTRKMARGLKVVGLMNVQYAIADKRLYVLEVNPRASRTVPYVAKATGVPIVKVATRLMLGQKLSQLGFGRDLTVNHYCVKTPVFPFVKFPGVDPRLSPEMKSTGEVMGIAEDFGTAFYKAQLAAGLRLPSDGTVFLSANDRDKLNFIPIARRFISLGFKVVGTSGTSRVLRDAGLPVDLLWKVSEGRPNCVDAIRNRQIDLIINTPLGETSFKDGWAIRTAAIQHNVPCITTLSGASAAAEAIAALRDEQAKVICLQDLHRDS